MLPSYIPPPEPHPAPRSVPSTPGKAKPEQEAARIIEPKAPATPHPISSVVDPQQVIVPVALKPTTEARVKTTRVPKEFAEPGRGGRQHKYLQHLIKQLAEERGFRASIEESILDGAGRVDVALVRGKSRIAFEISVTTNQDHELGNIEKCLAAGYSEVVLAWISTPHN